ncbi:MAG: DNA primase [Dehalococcoidales bacterium]|nr:DNA primase [Dehalococcoidales bacterium]
MSVIDEVKQRTDIVEVIGQYVTLTKSGHNFRGLCPFHSEKHPSFFVYPEQGSWHCFGACATGGDVFSFIMKKENIDFGEALRILAERAGVSLPTRVEPSAKREERERLYQINEAAAQYFHDLLLNAKAGEKARSYVAGRGLSAETLAKFRLGLSLNSWEALKQHLTEIGYAPEELAAAGLTREAEGGKSHDYFRNRLMFPICDLKGNVTGFGARALDDDSMPKYLNSPQTLVFDKSHTLYGINLAAPAIRERDFTVMMEGYMDVITAHQNGFDNAIAAMGTAVTESQINTLKRLSRNLILALDADEAGREAMLRCVGYENILDAEVRVITPPEGKDPDDVIREEPTRWQQLLDKAQPVIDYTFDMTTAGLDMTSARDKTLATDRLLPVISAIKNPIRQAHYLQKLASLVNVDERRLEAELARLKQTPSRYKAPKQEAVSPVPPSITSRPVEEYCLALLLQHPELKGYQAQPSPEHFENSENREIFTGWQKAEDLSVLKASLDPTLLEHFDYLLDYLKKKAVPTNQIERRYADCVLNLRKKYLQGLEVRRAEIFALEAETGGAGADLAKLEAEGIEPSAQLLEVFRQTRHQAKSQGAKE